MKRLLTIVFLIPFCLQAQVFVDPLAQSHLDTFAINDYTCPSCNSSGEVAVYPSLRYAAFSPSALDIFNGVNVENYAAIGNDSLPDEKGIETAANVAVATGKTLYFPAKLFKVKKMIELLLPAGGKLKVYARNAILRMMDTSTYSMFDIVFPDSTYDAYDNTVIWVGGTIDGNQYNQKYPLNPHGGVYDTYELDEKKWWEQAHGSLITVDWGRNVVFNGLTILNSVVDGISARKCRLTTMSDCSASGGAPLKWSLVREQGTYFKATRKGMKKSYFFNLRCIGASIGIQVSWKQDDLPFDTTTLCVIKDCYFENNDQNSIHIEDCAKTYIYRVKVMNDSGRTYTPQLLLSNRSIIVSIIDCDLYNQHINFQNSQNLRIGIVKRCRITNTDPRIPYAIYGATHVYGCKIKGKTTDVPVKALYAARDTFLNYGAQFAIQQAYQVDHCDFTGTVKPIQFRDGQGARCYSNVYRGIPTAQQNVNTTAPAGWDNVWKTFVNIRIKGQDRKIFTRDDNN